MATPNPLKASLQPSDWVRAGTVRLAGDGIESVRVELLARDLHVSKGSFYWHFHDREELLGKILSHWEEGERARLSSCASEAAAQRWAWFIEQNSSEERVQMELAIRGWARKDPKVAAVVRKADEETCRYIADVLREIGFERSSAEAWAELVLLVCLGWLDRSAGQADAESKRSSLGNVLSRVVLAASGPSSRRNS